MNPINILAPRLGEAIRQSRLTLNDTAVMAHVVVNGLTDERIVDHAVTALKVDGWTTTPEGPMGVYEMSDDDLRNIARTVLGSVGGA